MRIVSGIMALLRVAVGWHFLYEGFIKILNPEWSARSFLEGSRWIFSDIFKWMASSEAGLRIVDTANAYGLALIGLALMLGIFIRVASWSGIALLFLYYMAYPPFGGLSFGAPAEGNYLIVSKNLIELFVLALLAFTQLGREFGLETLLRKKRAADNKEATEEKSVPETVPATGRRQLIKGLIGVPVLAGFGGAFARNLQRGTPDATTGATVKFANLQLKDLKGGELPKGNLGDMPVSRMILGCNILTGTAHEGGSGLLYVKHLLWSYNTAEKVMYTLHLAEKAGVDTIQMNPYLYKFFNRYKKMYGGEMQSICTVNCDLDVINEAIDFGAESIYINGVVCDYFAQNGRLAELEKPLEYIRKHGYLAGAGAHSIETVKAIERMGLPVDYYMKTIHSDNYENVIPPQNRFEYAFFQTTDGFTKDFVRAKPKDPDDLWNDNMWDMFPDRTIEYMNQVKKPWIGFKVLAAGRIPPEEGFRYAYENGADFICVGMFDFQVIKNINLVNEILASLGPRQREWFG